MVLDNIGVLELLEDGDLSADLLLGDELAVHFLDGDLLAVQDIPALVDLPVRALSDAVFFGEDVVPHLHFNLVVHLL